MKIEWEKDDVVFGQRVRQTHDGADSYMISGWGHSYSLVNLRTGQCAAYDLTRIDLAYQLTAGHYWPEEFLEKT